MTIPGFNGGARSLINLGIAGFAVTTDTNRIYIIHRIPGDYDDDGTVGRSDFDLWKTQYGSMGDFTSDGNGDGQVNAADYTIWRNNVGVTMGGSIGGGAMFANSVPEPNSFLLVWVAAAYVGSGARGGQADALCRVRKQKRIKESLATGAGDIQLSLPLCPILGASTSRLIYRRRRLWRLSKKWCVTNAQPAT